MASHKHLTSFMLRVFPSASFREHGSAINMNRLRNLQVNTNEWKGEEKKIISAGITVTGTLIPPCLPNSGPPPLSPQPKE
jgi:hypothetical protein